MDSKPHDLIGAILTGQLQTLTPSKDEEALLRKREINLRSKNKRKLVLAEGIEPSTSRLQGECSSN